MLDSAVLQVYVYALTCSIGLGRAGLIVLPVGWGGAVEWGRHRASAAGRVPRHSREKTSRRSDVRDAHRDPQKVNDGTQMLQQHPQRSARVVRGDPQSLFGGALHISKEGDFGRFTPGAIPSYKEESTRSR